MADYPLQDLVSEDIIKSAKVLVCHDNGPQYNAILQTLRELPENPHETPEQAIARMREDPVTVDIYKTLYEGVTDTPLVCPISAVSPAKSTKQIG